MGRARPESGSAALYRQLYDRLVNHHKLRNLVWVWNADGAGDAFRSGCTGSIRSLLPRPGIRRRPGGGPRRNTPFAWHRDAELSRFAVGKVIGLGLDGWEPTDSMLEQPAKWAWFLANGADRPEALRALYANPHVISRQ